MARKGTGAVLGALLFFLMIFGSFVPFLMYENNLQQAYDRALIARQQQGIDQLNERMTISVVLLKSGHLGLYANDTGAQEEELSWLWVTNSSGVIRSEQIQLYVGALSGSKVVDTNCTYSGGRYVVKAVSVNGGTYAGAYG